MLASTLNLAARVSATRKSRRPITLPNIAPTQAQASDLAAIYLKVVRAWHERLPAIVAEYAKTISELTTDSAATTTGEIDGVAEEIRRLVLTLTPDLRRWGINVERVLTGKWVRGVLSATDVDLSTVLSPTDMTETVEASLNWNTALVRDVSEEIRRKISNAVFAGFQRRAPATEIAKEIAQATSFARSRSLRIAADQTVKFGARLNQARQEQAGITHFKWRHSGKIHYRSWHLARNGHVYPWQGSGIPASDMPGVPPFCGCTGQAVLVFDDE